MNEELRSFSLYDHLAELRTRLVRCVWALLILTGVCYGYSEQVFNFIRAPITPYLPNGGLIYTGPMDKFVAHIKLAFVCGVILSCPVWLAQIWGFISPGLYLKERKYGIGFIISGTGLFLGGAAFSYWIVLPMAFKFLMTFGGDVDKPMISIDQYLGFFTQMCLVFGAAFELPLVITLLGIMGIVSQKFLKDNRKYAVMALAVLSAIITPPDLLSMLMLLGPMILLFEVSVILVGFFERKKALETADF